MGIHVGIFEPLGDLLQGFDKLGFGEPCGLFVESRAHCAHVVQGSQ